MTNEEQILIDRMVDGELKDEKQRELLLSCEKRQAWRELALAYVESQALKAELTLLVDETTTPPSEMSVGRNREPQPGLDWKPFSLAAAILLSLGVGYGFGWLVQDRDALSGSVDVAENDDVGEARLPTMRFTVHDPSIEGLRQVDLPILKASDLGPDWLRQLEAGLPEDYVRELRGRGVEIKRTRTLNPVDLGDGRSVIVPIDYYFEQRYQ